MKKKTLTTIVTVWLLLLFIALTPMLTVKSANADTKVAMQWGHLYPNQIEGEKEAEEWICNKTYWNFYYNTSFGPVNAYGTYTTLQNVANSLQWIQNPWNDVDWATTWWVGDFVPEWRDPQPDYHRGFFPHSGPTIWDYHIYKYANYFYFAYIGQWLEAPSKQYFDFIWTCANGGLFFNSTNYTYNVTGITEEDTSQTEPTYTPTNNFTKYGFIHDYTTTPPNATGMPFGWTGTTSMSTDGYASPSGSYTYIGWENPSPWMTEENENQIQNKWFPYYFYESALGEGGTIKQSLDYATSKMYSPLDKFDQTELYSGKWVPGMEGWLYTRMRVFGNGNMVLP
jgi:hypothetical protein